MKTWKNFACGWFVCLVVVFMLVFLSPSPIVRAEDKVQDLGWLEWTWSYDNFARWQSGGYGAFGEGRTMCWNRYLPSKAPLNLEVHLKLYHQGECVAEDDADTEGVSLNEILLSIKTKDPLPQDDTWWFTVHHVCEPDAGLYDDAYSSYQVPGRDYGYPTFYPPLEIHSDLLSRVGLQYYSEPTPICNVLSGQATFSKQTTQNLRRLYRDLEAKYHHIGDLMPAFFEKGGSAFGLLFPQKDGSVVIVTLQHHENTWLVRNITEFSGSNID